MNWRNRIVEQVQIPVADLHENPSNWRKHPRAQAQALEGMVDEVGFVQGVLFNRRTNRLIDGHLRVELARKHGVDELPVTVVDLDESEEQLVLATLDPIGAMARHDDDQLSALLASVGAEHDAAVNDVLESLTRPSSGGTDASGVLQRDIRYTPAWAVEALLEHLPPPPRVPVLDPCAGNGAILRVVKTAGYGVTWIEARQDHVEELRALGEGMVGDWLQVSNGLQSKAIITNPPYSIGPQFMAACLRTLPKYCAALLRLNHLGSSTWFDFWRRHPPNGLLVLASRRPSFSGDGKTDASEYLWVIWSDEPARWLLFV